MDRLRLFAVLLRILSIVIMLAFFAVFLPDETMHRIHEQMGLGAMPQARIVSYLARTLSLFYAFQGALLFYLSFRPEKYLGFLRFYLWLSGAFASGVLLIDISIGMPVYWILFEGPFALILVVVLLLILRKT